MKATRRVLLFANGAPPVEETARRLAAEVNKVVCANGGALHALALGIRPQVVVGDLDSLAPPDVAKLQAQGTELVRHPQRKAATDLELALQVAVERGAEEITLLGALGGRLDQMLANLLLLTRPEWGRCRFVVIGAGESAWLLRGGESVVLEGKEGELFSVIPLSQRLEGLSISGAEYPLREAAVQFGSTLTVSNALSGRRALIRLQQGLALVIQQAREAPPETLSGVDDKERVK